MATAGQTSSLCVGWGVSKRPVIDPDGSARHGRRPGCDRWLRAARLGIRCVFLGLAGGGAILAVPGSGWTAGQPGPADDAPGNASAPSAEVAFDAPRCFVTLLEPSTKRQRLYGAGDIVPDAKGPGGEHQITRIEKGRLQLASFQSGKATWIAVGGVLPGGAGWRVMGTPSLRRVEYRYVQTGGPLDAEPRLVELREDRARLEVDIPLTLSASPAVGTAVRATAMPSQSPEAERKFEKTLLGGVRVKPTADDSYEINAADLNAALESGVQLLAEAWPKVWPSGSVRAAGSVSTSSRRSPMGRWARGGFASRVRISRSEAASRSAT